MPEAVVPDLDITGGEMRSLQQRARGKRTLIDIVVCFFFFFHDQEPG